MAQGEVDVNICSLKNDLRYGYSVFSDLPMAKNENALFVGKSDNFVFSQLDDLKNKTLGKVRGVSLGNVIDNFLLKNTRVVVVEDYARLFRMLELKRIDALIVSRKSGNAFLKKINLSQKIVDLPFTIIDAELYISISKKSKYLDTAKD